MSWPNTTPTGQPADSCNFETTRLITFDSWATPFINKTILAKSGMYFLKEADKVKCQFCKVVIGNWAIGDDPIKEHMRWSSSCPLLRRSRTRNIPINAEELDAILPPSFRDVCGHDPISDPFEIKYPKYRHEIDRIDSFKQWPQALSQKRDDFINTGLFYTGNGDKVICFSCGVGLKNWEAGDDPSTEHARWTDNCQHLERLKGEKFVSDVKKGSEIKRAEGEESNPCVICLEYEKTYVFIPCGHMATCGKCTFKIDNCPICRSPIARKQKVYMV